MTLRKHSVSLLALCLCLFLAVLLQPAMAEVLGNEGIAPALEGDTPGVERPFPQDMQKFTFAIIGDKTGGGEKNWPILERALDEVNRLRPDFAIMVGDLIQGYTTDVGKIDSQWREFMEHVDRIEVPFFFLPGNHDITNKVMYDYWQENVGRTYYSFDYRDCHFMLLNTEEGWRSDERQFGAMQMEFIRRDLLARGDAKHTFLFMHKPAWNHQGEELEQWETIESYLGDRPYTVFAGHWHRLIYQFLRDHRYFVLGPTGAELTPNEVLQLGRFHHYSMVTVDGNDVHVAFVQPGSVHPSDIAPSEFAVKQGKILSYRRAIPLSAERNQGQFVAQLENTLDKTLTIRFQFSIPEETTWSIAPNEASHVLRPGEKSEIVFNLAYDVADIAALPSYRYEVSYGEQRLSRGDVTLAPVDPNALVPVKTWMVTGPFELPAKVLEEGVTKPTPSDIDFAHKFPPELPSGAPHEIEWVEASTDANGLLNLQNYYEGDYQVAYGQCAVHSPREQLVAVSVKGDDVTSVFANGEDAHAGFPERGSSRSPDYFVLPLKKGWNKVTVKCADYTGGWGYHLQISDPEKDLVFAASMP